MHPSQFYEQDFLEALNGGACVPRTPSPAAEIGDLWGVQPSAAFGRLADFLGTQHESEPRLGEFLAFDPADWLPGSRNAFDFMLSEWFRRAALLSGTIPLGCTGSGDIWLVEVATGSGEHPVFLLDHELNELHAIADSLETFAWLCHLARAKRTRTIDEHEWAVVAGRVRGWSDLAVPGAHLLPESARSARHASVSDLLAALWHGPQFAVGPATSVEDTPSVIASALRCFLREEDDALMTILDGARGHPARIVRDAAHSLAPKCAIHGYEARHRSLGTIE